MNSRRYWKNRLPFLLTNLVCMAALTVFLLVCGNSFSAVVLILIVWALILLTGLALTYWKRKRQMKKLLDMAEQLSERYLISEVMELPEQAEDQVYYRLLKMAGKSMLEQIGEIERERLEYKEYIEQWIHEIKTPITAMKLLCENHRTDWTKELLLELEKTNRFTEQALYYARSEHIIPDEIAQVLLPVQSNRFVMTQYPLPFKTAEMLEQLLGRSYPEDPDKDNLAGYSTTVHTTEVNRIIALNFILKASLIYGAIVLMVMCLTVLALQQLLDAEKNNYRFSVLRKMGVEEKDLHTLVLKQLGVWFGMPITAAIVVAMIVIGYFLQSVSAEISVYIGCGALMRQIGIIVGIFALLLSCYFLSTWLLFQRSIRSNSDSVR